MFNFLKRCISYGAARVRQSYSVINKACKKYMISTFVLLHDFVSCILQFSPHQHILVSFAHINCSDCFPGRNYTAEGFFVSVFLLY